MRRMLDGFLDSEKGDLAINTPDVHGLHPHMNIGALQEYIAMSGDDPTDYTYVTVTRHPIEMLWSYFKYFQPAKNGKYNFSKGWSEMNLMEFEDWVLSGKIGANPTWRKHWPAYVSTNDLSPLSLEAHVFDREGKCLATRILFLEEPLEIEHFFSEALGEAVSIPSINKSSGHPAPSVGAAVRDTIRRIYPLECAIYSV